MATFEEVEAFVRETAAISKPLAPSDRLEEDLGITGDDYFELIEEFSKRFEVNIDAFIWYFHCHEEAFNPGALFFPPPSRQVERIAITVHDLFRFASVGRWAIDYPPHRLAKRRYDIYITWVLYGSIPVIPLLMLLIKGKSC